MEWVGVCCSKNTLKERLDKFLLFYYTKSRLEYCYHLQKWEKFLFLIIGKTYRLSWVTNTTLTTPIRDSLVYPMFKFIFCDKTHFLSWIKADFKNTYHAENNFKAPPKSSHYLNVRKHLQLSTHHWKLS